MTCIWFTTSNVPAFNFLVGVVTALSKRKTGKGKVHACACTFNMCNTTWHTVSLKSGALTVVTPIHIDGTTSCVEGPYSEFVAVQIHVNTCIYMFIYCYYKMLCDLYIYTHASNK